MIDMALLSLALLDAKHPLQCQSDQEVVKYGDDDCAVLYRRTVLAHHLPISHTHEAGLGSGRHLLFFLPLFPEEDAARQ